MQKPNARKPKARLKPQNKKKVDIKMSNENLDKINVKNKIGKNLKKVKKKVVLHLPQLRRPTPPTFSSSGDCPLPCQGKSTAVPSSIFCRASASFYAWRAWHPWRRRRRI